MSTKVNMLFCWLTYCLLRERRRKKPGRQENTSPQEELHFVERINMQLKAGWRIRKYKSKQGQTMYTMDSN